MDLNNTSKFMSLILRHKPEVIGIKLDERGWADVEELIGGIAKTRKFNREMLEEIVRGLAVILRAGMSGGEGGGL